MDTPASRLTHVAQQKTEILDAMMEWFSKGSGADDALDDPRLYDAFKSFLLHSPSEHDPPRSHPDFQESQVQDAWGSLEQTRKSVATVFLAQTSRPTPKKPAAVLNISDSSDFGIEPPVLESITATDFVKNVDAMVSAAFQNMPHEVFVARLLINPLLIFLAGPSRYRRSAGDPIG